MTRRVDPKPKAKKAGRGADSPKAVSATAKPDPLLIDDEMAEIQAILKKRGIS